MKILLGVPEYPPHHIGGGGEVYKNLAEGYLKEGHNVIVIYGYYKAKWFDSIKKYNENGITFYQIPEIPYPRKLPFLKTVMPIGLINYFKLKKIIKKEKVDIAHLHGYGHFFIDSLGRICKRLNINFIFTNHGFPKVPNQKGGIIKFIWSLYMKYRGDFLNKYSSKITCVSEFTKNEYNNYFNKLSVIGNGTREAISFSTEEIEKLKKEIGNGKKILLSVGRITEYKGFQDVIAILKDIPEYIYVIIGKDQDYINNLKKIAKEKELENRIKFLGFIPREKLDLYYKASDIVIIPSHVESFGLIGLEGLINKKIVIHSGIQGLSYLYNSTNAYSYENNISKIKELLSKKLIYKNEHFCEQYSWENIVKKYLQLMK